MNLFVFFFNNTATPDIYTLSLHDALPISPRNRLPLPRLVRRPRRQGTWSSDQDRKSTRLNSSHRCISYAVFCLKKKITPYGESDRRDPSLMSIHFSLISTDTLHYSY